MYAIILADVGHAEGVDDTAGQTFDQALAYAVEFIEWYGTDDTETHTLVEV